MKAILSDFQRFLTATCVTYRKSDKLAGGSQETRLNESIQNEGCNCSAMTPNNAALG